MHTELNVQSVYVTSIIHTPVFSFCGTKDTSQHNTAAAQYIPQHHLHTSHSLFSFCLPLYASSHPFLRLFPPPLLLPVIFASPYPALLLLLHLLLFFNPSLFPLFLLFRKLLILYSLSLSHFDFLLML